MKLDEEVEDCEAAIRNLGMAVAVTPLRAPAIGAELQPQPLEPEAPPPLRPSCRHRRNRARQRLQAAWRQIGRWLQAAWRQLRVWFRLRS